MMIGNLLFIFLCLFSALIILLFEKKITRMLFSNFLFCVSPTIYKKQFTKGNEEKRIDGIVKEIGNKLDFLGSKSYSHYYMGKRRFSLLLFQLNNYKQEITIKLNFISFLSLSFLFVFIHLSGLVFEYMSNIFTKLALVFGLIITMYINSIFALIKIKQVIKENE